MFTLSFRLTKRKIAVFFVICLTLVSGIFLLTRREAIADNAETTAKSMQVSLNAKTNDDRVIFLQSFGWEVQAEPKEIVEVSLPEEMDDVLREYNDIQKQQNMDLEKYTGKRVKRYTYEVINHPSGEQDVRANVLVYKNKIVGGDICTVRLDGFMHGFAMGETQANTVTYSETEQQVNLNDDIKLIEDEQTIAQDDIIEENSVVEDTLVEENDAANQVTEDQIVAE